MHFRLSFLVILFTVIVFACSTMPDKQHSLPDKQLPLPGKKPERPTGPLPQSAKPKYNLTGYPENTKQGYIDGCETAKRTSWGFKDLNRYEQDEQYRMGWDDGFALCTGKK